jgi:hypothetical protein
VPPVDVAPPPDPPEPAVVLALSTDVSSLLQALDRPESATPNTHPSSRKVTKRIRGH